MKKKLFMNYTYFYIPSVKIEFNKINKELDFSEHLMYFQVTVLY